MTKLDLAVLQAECFGMQRALLSEFDPDTKAKRDFLGWTKIDGTLYVKHMIQRLQNTYTSIPVEKFDWLQRELCSVVGFSAPECAISKIISAFVSFTKDIGE